MIFLLKYLFVSYFIITFATKKSIFQENNQTKNQYFNQYEAV